MNEIGAAWESWTPTLTQSGTVTNTVTYGKYMRIQKLIIAQCHLSVTGSGTTNNAVKISLPITAATDADQVIGSGFIYDVSTTTIYNTSTQIDTTTTAVFYPDQTGSGLAWGQSPNLALANGDLIKTFIIYEGV